VLQNLNKQDDQIRLQEILAKVTVTETRGFCLLPNNALPFVASKFKEDKK
jgi:hypothetical protein